MQNLFMIGELASIFNETTETFRYYDRIGLLKPYLTKENGYRYYSLDQFEIISTILYLRSIGTPIDRIKTLLHSQSKSQVSRELQNQRQKLREQINHLSQLEEQANHMIHRFDDFTSGKIRI